MGYSKEELLARLQELQVDFAQYDHPVVLTVEAQAKYVGHMKGALSKNLFLKDKKHRFYIVSSLANTKVDLKILSQRLGLGKGGLRMAPEEALGEILQMVEEDVHSLIEMDNPKGLENVSLGCVTPFAVVNESARHVSLLLDKGFKSQECCFFHPLSNDMSISLDATNLDKFLKSIGRDPIYVDLEANPPVGKDQPPDLAAVVPSDALILQDFPEKAVLEKKDVIVDNNPTAATAKAFKPSNGPKKEKSVNAINKSRSYTDPEKFVEEILEKASAIIISETNEENFKQHGEQLGAVVSYSIKKKLNLELQNLAMTFKNAAYAEGFSAGKHYQPYRM